MTDPTTDRIAGVLAAHRVVTHATRRKVSCTCVCGAVVCEEQKPYAPMGMHDAAFRAHVAAVLADLFGDAQADAWDEGFKHRHSGGRRDETDSAYMVYGPNPYRRGTDDGEDDRG